MKFRLRGQAFKVPKLVEFEGSNVSVAELKCRISEILDIAEGDVKDIKLSMNGKHILECQDDNLLASLDFVSGDTIYIMGIQQTEEPAAKAVKCDQPIPVQPKQESKVKSHLVQPIEIDPVQPSEIDQDYTHPENATYSTSCEQPEETETKFFKDVHYIPVCDTSTGAIPKALEDLKKKANISSSFEEIAGLLHILMVEAGFLPITENFEDNAYITLPDSWQNAAHGTLMLHYKTALPPYGSCDVIISDMNRRIIVHAALGSSVSRTMKLRPCDYQSLIGGNRLRQLSLSFKNEISFPLLVSMQREAGGFCPANLSNLPAEMLYTILGRLDAKSLCRLTVTSQFFRKVCNRPEIWKKLVLRDFGKHYSSSSDDGWKRIYQNEVKATRWRSRSHTSPANHYHPPYPPRVPYPFGDPHPFGDPCGIPSPFEPYNPRGIRPPLGFPGILGGDEDARPNFGPYAPPSRRDPFRHGGRPQPRFI